MKSDGQSLPKLALYSPLFMGIRNLLTNFDPVPADTSWRDMYGKGLAGLPSSVRPRPPAVATVIARLNIGGPAVQTVLLTDGLAKRRFRTHLITGVVGAEEGDMMFFARNRHIDPMVIPELGREISWKNDFVAFRKLVRAFREIRPDIVHTHTAKAGFLGRLAALMAGVPIRVHSFHGHVFHGYFNPWKAKAFVVLERILGRFTHRLVVLTESQRRELVEKYKIGTKDVYRVIPVGLDIDGFKEATEAGEEARKKPGDSTGHCRIGLVGRLVSIKNPFMLVQALDMAQGYRGAVQAERSGRPSGCLQVNVIGGGDLEDSMKQYVRERGLQEAFVFLGWQSQRPQMYAGLDLVVLPSLNEGLPVVLVEAMASAKPFIATDVGGVRDLMEGAPQHINGEVGGYFSVYENGILVPPQDVPALASALIWILVHRDELPRMGKVGRRLALERYAKERLIEDMAGLYNELLDAQHARLRVA